MSIVNLLEIENEINRILIEDPRTMELSGDKLTVMVEEDFQYQPDRCPWIGVFLDSFTTAQEKERIGAGLQFRTELIIELQLVQFGLENKAGAERRAELFQQVKEVIKENRTLGGTVDICWFGGGDFTNAKLDGGGFFKGVNLQLICEVTE